MIAFDLECANGHTFEGWFEDNRAYEQQKKKDLITCPVCNDNRVSKVLSPVSIKSSTPSPEKVESLMRNQKALAEMTREVVEYVQTNFDDVGHDFSKEALKIHYGVTEPRNIRGVSTENEEKMLKEEGIEYFKIPVPVSNDQDS